MFSPTGVQSSRAKDPYTCNKCHKKFQTLVSNTKGIKGMCEACSKTRGKGTKREEEEEEEDKEYEAETKSPSEDTNPEFPDQDEPECESWEGNSELVRGGIMFLGSAFEAAGQVIPGVGTSSPCPRTPTYTYITSYPPAFGWI
jgi:hypothetical protein